MSSSGGRKFALRQPAVVDMGCSCRRPRLLPSFMSSSSWRKTKSSRPASSFSPTSTSVNTTSSSSLWEDSLTADAAATPTTASIPSRCHDYISSPAVSAPQSPTLATKSHERIEKGEKDEEKKKKKKMMMMMKEKKERKGVVDESVAVVKESSDPYRDFRDSMLQMIMEMDIYAWEDLRDLLHRFLALNSPRHHPLIFCAFAEIWGALFSVPPSSSPSSPASASSASSSHGGRRR